MTEVTVYARVTFYAVLAAACFYLTSEGAANCYDCNSNDDKSCIPQSLDGVSTRKCRSGESHCAVYKKEPPSPDGNTSNHQYVRYCATECLKFNTTYTTGREGATTKHCVLCCSQDLCNNFTMDPCNPSKAGHLGYETFTISLLGVLAVVLRYLL
ncbi:uncharacterized protein LOC144662465 [Oculina patagonica]